MNAEAEAAARERRMNADTYFDEIERRAVKLRGLVDGLPLEVRRLCSTIANLAHGAPRRRPINRKSQIQNRKSKDRP